MRGSVRAGRIFRMLPASARIAAPRPAGRQSSAPIVPNGWFWLASSARPCEIAAQPPWVSVIARELVPALGLRSSEVRPVLAAVFAKEREPRRRERDGLLAVSEELLGARPSAPLSAPGGEDRS